MVTKRPRRRLSLLGGGGTHQSEEASRQAAWRRQVDALYREHFGAVVRRARWLVGEGAAEDVAQEAFVRLWHTPPRDPDRALPYLRVIVARLAVDWRRQSAHDAAARPDLATAPSPEAKALQGEAWDEVRSALDHLPERDRQALWMRASGFRYQEIAARLGIPPGQVGVVLWRAVHKVQGRVSQGPGALETAKRGSGQ